MKGSKATKRNKNRKNGLMQLSSPSILKNTAVLKPQRITLHVVVGYDNAINTAHDQVFYINDAYNPLGTLSAGQGYWFDQMGSLYKKCFVESVRWKVWATDVVASRSIAVVFPSTDVGAVTNGFQTVMMRPSAKALMFPIVSSNVTPCVSGTTRIRDFVDYKDWQDAEGLTSSTQSDTLTTGVYLHVSTDSAEPAQKFLVELWQDTIFFAPITQVAS